MNYFLVDYENVNVSGLNGVSSLNEDDVVIIFYSENANTLTFGMHRRINESKAEIKFQKVAVNEKNALDFQLCSFLGFLISDTLNKDENVKNNFYIVSNDNGYSVLIDYWKRIKIDLKIVSDLSKKEMSQEVKTVVNLNNQTTEHSEIKTILGKMLNNKAEVSEVIIIVNSSKTKVEVNNNLCKIFGSQKGGEIYRSIKSFIAAKNSN